MHFDIPSRVIAVRHDKVDMRWPGWCSAEEFAESVANYDLASLKQRAPDSGRNLRAPLIKSGFRVQDASGHGIASPYDVVVTSSLRRTGDTAVRMAPGNQVLVWADLDEVPLSPVLDKAVLPGWLWLTLDRVAWLLGLSGRPESRRETYRRAYRAARRLSALLRDNPESRILVVSHGWFLSCLRIVHGQLFAMPARHRRFFKLI